MSTQLGSTITAEMLQAYSAAALSNAKELFEEASLLLAHGHYSRAYFLAVSCVEETGKSLQSFHGQKRNLNDPAVCKRLKQNFENHDQKINYALGVWAFNSSDPRKAIQVAVDLMVDLQSGREPAMYTDLRDEPDYIQRPCEVVGEVAANDCVRLAGDCIANAEKNLTEKEPPEVSAAHDKFFVMKSKKFQDMLNSKDFWWFALSKMEKGITEIAEIVIEYDKIFLQNGVLFKSN